MAKAPLDQAAPAPPSGAFLHLLFVRSLCEMSVFAGRSFLIAFIKNSLGHFKGNRNDITHAHSEGAKRVSIPLAGRTPSSLTIKVTPPPVVLRNATQLKPEFVLLWEDLSCVTTRP